MAPRARARGSRPKSKVEDFNKLTTRLGGLSTQPIEPKPIPKPKPTESSAAAPATTTTTAQSRREALPLPTPFDGDRTLYPSWRLCMELKLKADDEFIGDDQNKWHVIFTSLAPNVQRVVSGFFVQGDTFNYDPERFFEKLDLLYEDYLMEQRAMLQVMSVRQGPEERFQDFYLRFEELLGRAGGEEWPDFQKIIELEQGLNERMQGLCKKQGSPEEEDGYEMAVQYLRQLDFGTEILEMRPADMVESGEESGKESGEELE